MTSAALTGARPALPLAQVSPQRCLKLRGSQGSRVTGAVLTGVSPASLLCGLRCHRSVLEATGQLQE